MFELQMAQVMSVFNFHQLDCLIKPAGVSKVT